MRSPATLREIDGCASLVPALRAPQVLAPRNDVQVLSVYLAALVNDDTHFDFHVFKAVGLFYALPIFVIYLFFQNKLMTIYGGGTKG